MQQGRVTLAPGRTLGTLSGTVSGLGAYDELIPSWNALTPPGSSLSLEVKPAGASRFYSFGTWQRAAGRTSKNGQKDSAAQVMTDTLRLGQESHQF